MDLLSKDQGSLRLHVRVSGGAGEERFRFQGNMMLVYAIELMSHWIIGYKGRGEIEPKGDLCIMMLHRGKYWFSSEKGKLSQEKLDEICAGLDELADENKRLVRWADEIRIFNPARTENWDKPLIKIRRSSAHEMMLLDCSLSELAGLVYAVRDLNIGCGFDIYSQRFFSVVPLKKPAPTEKPKKKAGAPESAAASRNSQSLAMDAILYRKLQDFHLQSLL